MKIDLPRSFSIRIDEKPLFRKVYSFNSTVEIKKTAEQELKKVLT